MDRSIVVIAASPYLVCLFRVYARTIHGEAAGKSDSQRMTNNPSIPVDDLRIGLYVELDLKWFEHPFAFSAFRIRSEEQIRTIRSLGL